MEKLGFSGLWKQSERIDVKAAKQEVTTPVPLPISRVVLAQQR